MRSNEARGDRGGARPKRGLSTSVGGSDVGAGPGREHLPCQLRGTFRLAVADIWRLHVNLDHEVVRGSREATFGDVEHVGLDWPLSKAQLEEVTMFVASASMPEQLSSPSTSVPRQAPGTMAIVKSRSRDDRGEKYYVDELSLLQCDFFDAALRHPGLQTRDRKGRIKIRLAAEQHIVRQALLCIEVQHYEAPDDWGRAAKIALHNLLDFLSPRPLVQAREAQAVADATGLAGYSLLAPGSFLMGSPLNEPDRRRDEVQHAVTLTEKFYLKSTPVTLSEYLAVMGVSPSTLPTNAIARPAWGDHPATNVTFYQALAYCNLLSAREGFTPCYDLGGWRGHGAYAGPQRPQRLPKATGYRLPTEAEWEYAARAGTTAATYAVAGQTLGDLAWYADNSGGTTHAVGRKAANKEGLFDMIGLNNEWCEDIYGLLQPTRQVDPRGAEIGDSRVVRSIWYGAPAKAVRIANRGGRPPFETASALGFRPAKSYGSPG